MPEAERVPELTLKGVTLFTKGQGRGSDIFDVVLTNAGIEIRRPGEDARHLPWECITEWEIERRRGGVRLFLRGGGSETPLVVPGWSVNDLDAVLRDLTTLLAEPEVGSPSEPPP